MKGCLACLFLLIAFSGSAQDLTGTWEGDFVVGIDGQMKRVSKMRLELVQLDMDVKGVVTRYPEDTKANDSPNVIYTVSGKLGKKQSFPFLLIKGRSIEGTPNDVLFEYIINYRMKDSVEYIGGRWYKSLEPLATSERGGGVFQLQRVSSTVSDKLKQEYKNKLMVEKHEHNRK
jgi:hypothetical protein